MGGLIASALRVPLKVPEDQVERACAVLSALDEYDEIDPHDAPSNAPSAAELAHDGPYRGGPMATDDALPPRKKSVAVAAAILLPMVVGAFGAGHFYVREYAKGLGLLATAWVFAFIGINGNPLAWAVPLLVVAADIYGALTVIDRRAKRPTETR
jgi:TM2 domain-containing membrane protein YozV